MTEYVNKEEMLNLIVTHRQAVLQEKEQEKDRPNPPNSLVKMFVGIVDGIARRPNFRDYSFIEDMKQEALLDCCKKAHYFDPSVSSNPFGYFSRIIWTDFLNIIKSESEEAYVRAKLFYDSDSFDTMTQDEDFDVHAEGMSVPYFDIEGYEKKNQLGRYAPKRVKKKKHGPLSDEFDESDDDGQTEVAQ